MKSSKRTKNGNPITGQSVVATDAIVVLSGTSFGSVVKVLAAIELVRNVTGASLDEIIALANVPIDRAVFDGEHDARVAATDAFVGIAARSPAADALDYILRTKDRFNASTEV